MDRHYTVIGIFFVTAALGLMVWQGMESKKRAEEYRQQNPPQIVDATSDSSDSDSSQSTTPADDSNAIPALLQNSDPISKQQYSDEGGSLITKVEDKEIKPVVSDIEIIHSMENEFFKVDFTSFGGAIKRVALKKYAAEIGSDTPYIFNEYSDVPALSISLKDSSGSVHEYAPNYQLLEKSDKGIKFGLTLSTGVEVVREYSFSISDNEATPYIISHTTRFLNRTESHFKIDKLYVNVGTAAPTDSDPTGYLLNFGYYDGEKAHFINASKFKAGGFLGMFKRQPMDSLQESSKSSWVCVKNQFFTAIVTPKILGNGIYVKPVEFPSVEDDKSIVTGITGSIEFNLDTINPGTQRVLELDYYVGPKEHKRLSKLPENQELVMQFGFFKVICVLLLKLLINLEGLVKNYGIAIILMTLIIRLCLWPLTAKAARSAKEMSKIQEPLQQLKEKYKGSPEKLNKATLKLFKEHRINPAAGCFPILIQIPIFFALFSMLRSASELRFASFMWIDDLSLPDQFAIIGGIPINILPLLMGVTMFYQMKMTPTTADKTQQKIMQMMPVIFLVICYNFSSGLVLYWTVSNLFSIFQQVITNKSKDKEIIPVIEPETKEKSQTPLIKKKRNKPKKN